MSGKPSACCPVFQFVLIGEIRVCAFLCRPRFKPQRHRGTEEGPAAKTGLPFSALCLRVSVVDYSGPIPLSPFSCLNPSSSHSSRRRNQTEISANPGGDDRVSAMFSIAPTGACQLYGFFSHGSRRGLLSIATPWLSFFVVSCVFHLRHYGGQACISWFMLVRMVFFATEPARTE